MKTLKAHLPFIQNSFIYPFNNGRIAGINIDIPLYKERGFQTMHTATRNNVSYLQGAVGRPITEALKGLCGF